MPGRGGCMNEKNPPSLPASSMNRSSGTLAAECAPMHSSATPNAWKITLPAEDMKKTARRDAPLIPRSFSRSETGRSPIFNGSVRTRYTYVHAAPTIERMISDVGLYRINAASTAAVNST